MDGTARHQVLLEQVNPLLYRAIAERRVRLGLLLAAVGQRNNITVTPEETNRALIRQAQSFPGQEKKIIDLYRNNENLMASLRAPIFEDKVVDYILEMAQVSEREVSVEELLRDPDASEAASDSTAKAASKGGKKKSGSKRKAAGAGKDT
jgi:trigger factor